MRRVVAGIAKAVRPGGSKGATVSRVSSREDLQKLAEATGRENITPRMDGDNAEDGGGDEIAIAA